MEHQLGFPIKFAARGREVRLEEGFLVDGFCEGGGNVLPIVLSYHGCFFHGCVKCYKINRNKPVSNECDEIMDDRYERTLRVRQKILDSGKYRLIEIWGCEFTRQYMNDRDMRLYIDTHNLLKIKPLNPRNAFYGGRTENFVKIYDVDEDEEIRYVDVTSLYPYIIKTGRYPTGHPKIFVGDECLDLLGPEY